MKPSADSEGSSESGSVPRAVRKTIAPERLAMSDGSPHAEKMDEKESPITIVYCRLTESVRMPMSAEGTHAVLSPTDFDHASPHDLEPVAAHTRPTAEKLQIREVEAVHGAGVRAGACGAGCDRRGGVALTVARDGTGHGE